MSEQISTDLSENQKRRIAVVEFVDLKGKVTDLGSYLSEKLITKLFQTKKFRVVERQLLNKIITEQKLSLTGIIDPSTAQKLGRLLGVDAICTGSVSDLTKTLEINARLISTETGEVFSAASVEVLKDETVCNLMGGCNNNSANPHYDSDSATSNRQDKKPKSYVVESNFFSFELVQCRLSGTEVSCDLTITNKDSMDKKLGFEWNSNGRIFDEQGNKSTMSGWLIANQSSDKPTLLPNVATKANLKFKKVSLQAKILKKIELVLTTHFSEGGYYKTRDFVVTFQDITLQ
ncbi:MAG: CsgG/HfaB family protein [Acidobacteriota bacterium]|nr:CsgG/HfaB family protein [Acidobacteriota bacterium]